MSDESKVRLYHRLEDALGRDTATVLIEHLETVATKQDIADLRLEMRETFVTKVDFAEFKADLHRDLRTMAFALVGTNVALVAVATAVARLV